MASESSSLLSSSSSSGGSRNVTGGGPSYAAVASGEAMAPHSHSDSDVERGEHDHSAHGHSHGSNGRGHAHSHGHSHAAHSHAALQSTTPPRMSPRTAFAHRDAEASKRAHAAKRAAKNGSSPSGGSPKEEGHNTDTGEYIKSIVYGGLDGIITTFATVTSVAGAEFTAAVVVVLGISHLFADGLSMGLGDYMSSQAEIDYTASEREREQWEMDQNMKGEIEEMIDLYVAKGVSSTDARIIIHTLAKYPEAFLDHMMVEELGLLPPVITEQGFSPAKAGAITMCSFMCFGSVPLIPYLIALIPGVTWSADAQLWSAIVLTLVTLFLLGAFKGHVVEIGRSAWWKSGLLMAFNGSLAATIGYLCGFIISQWMELPPGAG